MQDAQVIDALKKAYAEGWEDGRITGLYEEGVGEWEDDYHYSETRKVVNKLEDGS